MRLFLNCRPLSTLSILLGFLFSPSVAVAEYCWMIGCMGHIGWLEINRNQNVVGNSTLHSGGTVYNYDPSGNVFTEQGLPDVNTTATIQQHCTPLLLPAEKEEIVNEVSADWRKRDIERDDRFKLFRDASFNSCQRAYPMADGAMVKILGYDYAKLDSTSRGLLFALVEVISDGR